MPQEELCQVTELSYGKVSREGGLLSFFAYNANTF